MEANELRLNNLVLVNGIIHKVLGIDEEEVIAEPFEKSGNICFDFCIYKLEPIPLTEEWLLRLGLEYDEHEADYVFESEKGLVIAISVDDNVVFIGRDYDFGKVENINFVHQLQNIVHSLTCEELKLKYDENN